MVCVCTCVCVFPRLMSGTFLYSVLFLRWAFPGIQSFLIGWTSWLVSSVLLSLFSQGRFTDVCHHTRVFTWLLGIWIQVLKFAERGFDLLSHLPSSKTPQNEIFKKLTLNTVT